MLWPCVTNTFSFIVAPGVRCRSEDGVPASLQVSIWLATFTALFIASFSSLLSLILSTWNVLADPSMSSSRYQNPRLPLCPGTTQVYGYSMQITRFNPLDMVTVKAPWKQSGHSLALLERSSIPVLHLRHIAGKQHPFLNVFKQIGMVHPTSLVSAY